MLKTLLLCLSILFVSLVQVSYGAKKVIFISFDGFRHDYLDMAEKEGRNISAFKAIREQGFQAEVQNVMLTLTFPSHYAMATGRTVENHGLVGNNFFDPRYGLAYNYKKNEKNIQSWWFEFGGAEPIWNTNERHGGRSCVVQWVGSEARVHNRLAFATAGVYNMAYSLFNRIDRMLDWLLQPEFNLCMLYFNEPDSAGHSYGPNSSQVMDAVELTNEGVSYLLQRIDQIPELKDNVNIIISSDHGMAYTDCNTQTVNLSHVMDKDVFRFDSSPATLGLWPKNGTNLTEEDFLKRFDNIEHITAYLRKDIPDRYHYKNNRRIAPIFVVADQGWLISTRDSPYVDLCKLHLPLCRFFTSNMKVISALSDGMHGYDNANPEMHPFMVAAGPDIQNFKERQLFHQIDLYPFICALLGLDKPNRIDGLIDRTIPFMKNPPNETFLAKFRNYAGGIITP
ncbi:unnamed protein product [Rodentolepis nana]|uniref:AP3A hydrolase n=1 Tax=Rodentolepis nana TaxID=102285 RepID=A0A0R3TT26_RODNA|nr:unnamed protein product [Rodentolepis nana]